jgi:hypothetical protein
VRVRCALVGGLSLAAVAASVSLGERRGAHEQRPINGCADRKGGDLEIMLKGQGCGGGERKLTWNVQGPRGPQGVEGTTGAIGERGPRGDFAFDDFDGMACNDGSPGTITVSHDSDGFVTFTCEP